MRVERSAIWFVIGLAALLPQFVFGQTDTSIEEDPAASVARAVPRLTAEQRRSLLEQGEISVLHSDLRSTDTLALPLAPAFEDRIVDDLDSVDPTLAVETLFLLESPVSEPRITVELYTILQAISTMTGIEYYSVSRGERRVLFSESYVIAGPRNREPVDDPRPTSLPPSETIFIYQRDASFGQNVFEVDYSVTNDAVLLTMRNLTRMYLRGLIPAVAPDGLRLSVVVRVVDHHLLFYAACAARSRALFGLESQVQESFYNRLVALHDWFMGQASRLTR